MISVTALGQIKSCREFFEDGAANAPLFSSSGLRRVAPVFASDVRIVAMGHVILLGDSIFDSAPYTRGGPAVASQVRKLVPPRWTVSLLAVDGSSTDDISGQMQRLPKDATHLILSVGGQQCVDVRITTRHFVVWYARCIHFKSTGFFGRRFRGF